jgi:hypothetical protein
MKCALARLLSRFEFTLQQPADSVTYTSTLTLPIKGALCTALIELFLLLSCVQHNFCEFYRFHLILFFTSPGTSKIGGLQVAVKDVMV